MKQLACLRAREGWAVETMNVVRRISPEPARI
jgi:hypothetical protein